jgi:hypothetical protein
MAGVIATFCVPAFAATFTTNTTIGPGNTNYDGAPIVITNCTVAIDGPHTFASVLVASNGVLTHSAGPMGFLSNFLSITNEDQVLTDTNPVTLLDSNIVQTTVSVASTNGTVTYANGVDYFLLTESGDLTELQRTTNSAIADGATVLVSYEVMLANTPAGLNLTITSNVEVDAGGAINANAKGYSQGFGAGHISAGILADGSGGGYGGTGGMSSSNAAGGNSYGSFMAPNLGSGGGAGYAGSGGVGGGMIDINAGGNIINNGAITANGGNGTNSRSGGGSGGSIWLGASNVIGQGAIAASGGSGEPTHGGGGGGGRIAIDAGTIALTGSISARGGAGAHYGGAGTIYTQSAPPNGFLDIDNGGQAGGTTPLAIGDSSLNVLIQGEADVAPSPGAWSLSNLTIAANSSIQTVPNNNFFVTSTGAIVIEAGGALSANAIGSTLSTGRGLTIDNFGGGGAYGGNGGNSSASLEEQTEATGGTAYGSQQGPAGPGANGGGFSGTGGLGGGSIQITSTGGIVRIDGVLSANGGNGVIGGGGGAGGTVGISGGALIGSGSITANGGESVDSLGGGGGGGRMGISPSANLFSGAITAFGGSGFADGGAGTILVTLPGQTPQLILDNDGNIGTNTPLQTALNTDLIVRGGAIGSASSAVSFADLLLASNGWIKPANFGQFVLASVSFTITGNATIQAGGGIVADATATGGGVSGAGAGFSYSFGSTNLGGGGGHGGRGGASFGNYAAGGVPFDYPTAPAQAGGPGGGQQTSPGGGGGGVIRLTVNGTLLVDGMISANGGYGAGLGGGGGAGGSIWLSAGNFSGNGAVTADGGAGFDGLGGGGGGGIIYIPCNFNAFSGQLAAYGGGGANWGGAGTVIIQPAGSHSQLVLDDNGKPGPATVLPSSSTIDLTLRNGAAGLANPGLILGNVVIASNSTLFLSNSTAEPTISFASAIIQPGGRMSADLAGFGPGQGNGAGRFAQGTNYPCGGAGHGGFGAGVAGAPGEGGIPYDNATEPALPGSGGGGETPYSTGGAGGGVFRLMVAGLLQNDGVISANGGNGSGFGGGGGSGGTVWIAAGTFSGAGLVAANGGSGAALGGGGAGGCVAIYPTVDSFTGTMTAYGGGGSGWGGAGTVYVQNSPQYNQIIFDNNGQLGATTPVASESPSVSLILRNGALGFATGSVAGGSLLVSANSLLLVSNNNGQVNLTFTSASIQPGSGIVADFGGPAAGGGSGPGHPSNATTNYSCSGAGHGGYGASSAGNIASGGIPYDNPASPNALGSGGGADTPYSLGGAGGGQFHLTVNGLLQNNGVISANGGNGGGIGGGGGSGGSIWLTVGILSGAGAINVNGGSGADSLGGGGAGGCIAIYPTSNQFSGVISAYGGGGAHWGGAGTVYIQTSSNQFTLDNGGRPGAPTPVISSSSVTLGNGAVGLVTASISMGSLVVSSNAALLVSNKNTSVTLTLPSVIVQAGGGIIADSDGYTGGSGTGLGHPPSLETFPYASGGGGHGGMGGNGAGNSGAGGLAYDTQANPVQPGSGGGSEQPESLGGAGGGAIRFTISGMLQNDGVISANGGAGGGTGGGGGAGGSIWVSAGTISGDGAFTANGGAGAGAEGGGGGGGCIALYPSLNLFTGTVSAYGGGGANWGGAGTLFISGASTSQLILDNNGRPGAFTPLQPGFSPAVILRNGAAGSAQNGGGTFASLLVSSNALLGISTNSQQDYAPGSISMTITGNATVAAGGGIVADSAGSLAGQGNGAGHSALVNNDYVCSGGGYGGIGGNSIGITAAGLNGAAAGGNAYGSVTAPSLSGSGGGTVAQGVSTGGAGGAWIRLVVNGTLDDEGRISANGGNGSGLGGGGGSGGSILLTVGTLAGSGTITANGGNGVIGAGGGGGGGRIAIGCQADDFEGVASAAGGGGFASGGAGTIYVKPNASLGQLLLDNGGADGASTPFSAALGVPSQPFNLTIQHGATAFPQGNFPGLENLVIGPGGQLAGSSNQPNLDVLVLGNLDVAAGGLIAVDGEGYGPGSGPGAGQSINNDGSGAGYGGAGGASATAPGGASYGSATEPANWGSGGGAGFGPAVAGSSSGGGAIRLNVGGALTVDGEISANGGAGLQDNSGGGSGGSIWVTAGTLTGVGQFAADGGAGDLYAGGGGAGGRIALYSHLNAYFGLANASGGAGDFSGGNGAVYSNNVLPLQVISNSPNGIVTTPVSSVVLYFSAAPNPATMSGAGLSLVTPGGPLAPGSISLIMLGPTAWQLNFPGQTANGNYSVDFGAGILDLYGQPVSPAAVAAFTISLPVVQGVVTDASGNPVAGVLLQASTGSSAATGADGTYTLAFSPGTTFTVTPSLGALVFAPPSISYTNLSAAITNQNYLAVSTIAPMLAAMPTPVNNTNFVLSWRGLPGITYQIYSSTDLATWQPCGIPIAGSNATVQVSLPVGSGAARFFSVQASQ